MNAYQLWNDALASRFFNSNMAGINVHLYVNRDIIDAMERNRPEMGAFRVAIEGHTLHRNRKGICQRALHLFKNWRNRGLQFPPYIGYLSFFVLACDTDDDFAPHAYYPRLWELLGKHQDGPVPSFDRMWQLWDDLENWTMLDKQGELGIFQSRTIGGNRHIGYPLSQAILVEQDRKALPQIFYNRKLDPTAAYPRDELARALRSPTAKRFLRSRTIRLVEKRYDTGLYDAMLEAVRDELADWDGKVSESNQIHGKPALMFVGLRICIALDQVARTINATIRCRLNCDFPEDGMILDNALCADEDMNGWSMPIRNKDTGKILDASDFDWTHGVTMKATSPNCQLKLPAQSVRIFTSGMQEGLSGFIETHSLPQGQPFYLCYTNTCWPRLEQWAQNQCEGFHEITIDRGLPPSWCFACIKATIDNATIEADFPMLSAPSGVNIRLVGGIRSGRGNNFFDFAPPLVAINGGTADTIVYCNGAPLSPKAAGGAFALPKDLPSETRITLEAKSSGQLMNRLSLFLTGDFGIPSEPSLFLDSFGTGTESRPNNNTPFVSGAYIKGQIPSVVISAAEMFEDLESELAITTGYLIGPLPGQIVAWPSKPFPREWIPEWVIKKTGRKKLKAVFLKAEFVGEVLETVMENMSASPPTRRNIRAWKCVLWYWRKRISPPSLPAERTRWDQIQQVAHNV